MATKLPTVGSRPWATVAPAEDLAGGSGTHPWSGRRVVTGEPRRRTAVDAGDLCDHARRELGYPGWTRQARSATGSATRLHGGTRRHLQPARASHTHGRLGRDPRAAIIRGPEESDLAYASYCPATSRPLTTSDRRTAWCRSLVLSHVEAGNSPVQPSARPAPLILTTASRPRSGSHPGAVWMRTTGSSRARRSRTRSGG